jgi:hypothetical protein
MSAVKCPMGVFRELLAELLVRGESATFRVAGSSMRPTIVAGDVITVRGVDPAELRVGDIVAFRRGNSLCVHRIIDLARSPGGLLVFRTAGDGNPGDDGIQSGDALIGRVSHVTGRDGDWRPESVDRRVSGLFRVGLARHPRFRRALQPLKRAFRRLDALSKQEVPA